MHTTICFRPWRHGQFASGGKGSNWLAVRVQRPDRVVRLNCGTRLIRPFVQGDGPITQPPDRIVVGEVRDGAALDMLQAMNTGHNGSVTTVHANSPRDSISRLETMVLMAGIDLPMRAIREQVASAVDLIVHQQRLRDGSRRITHITEVVGMEGDVITLQDIFLYDFGMGVDELGRYRGSLKSTGLRPKFLDKLTDAGVVIPPNAFSFEQFAR